MDLRTRFTFVLVLLLSVIRQVSGQEIDRVSIRVEHQTQRSIECRVTGAQYYAASDRLGRDAERVEAESVPVGIRLVDVSGQHREAQVLRFESDNCWMPPSLAGDKSRESIAAWPLSSVEGVFAQPESPEHHPVRVMAEVIPRTRAGLYEAMHPAWLTTCELKWPEWRCAIPGAFPAALRVTAEGYAGLVYPDVIVPAGETLELGDAVLEEESRIVGRIVGPDGQALEGAVVEAGPATLRSRRGWRAPPISVVTDVNGVFEYVGLSQGRYQLESAFEGLSKVRRRVSVEKGRTVELGEWTQESLASVEIRCSPVVAPGGKPWLIRLLRVSDEVEPVRLKQVRSGEMSPSGLWVASRLPTGQYRVILGDSKYEVLRESIELQPGANVMSLAVAPEIVTGTLKKGTDPISAEIAFRRKGYQTVRTESDIDGEFVARFSEPGHWRPAIVYGRGDGLYEIRLPEVEIKKEKRLELAIPEGHVKGRIVDQAGEPKSGVVVVRNDTRGIIGFRRTSLDGTFELQGLSVGRFQIRAEGNGGVSNEATIDTTDAKDLTLVLQEKKKLAGSVQFDDGRPITGAIVRVLDPVEGVYYPTVTDVSGQFEVEFRNSTIAVASIVVLGYDVPVTIDDLKLSGAITRHSTVVQQSSSFLIFYVSGSPIPTLSRGGAPHTLARLLKPRGYGQRPEILADGGIKLEVAPGPYRLCVPDSEPTCEEFVVPPSAQLVFDFRSEEDP